MTSAERQIIAERDYKIQQIKDNEDLTQEAKQRYIRELTEWARNELRAVRAEEQQKIEAEVVASKRALYGIPQADAAKSAGERAQIFAAFRQARSDVALGTPDPRYAREGLHEILDEADRTGDALYARAVLHRALELSVNDVRDRYLADKPKDAANLERYNAALAREKESTSVESLLGQSLMEAG